MKTIPDNARAMLVFTTCPDAETARQLARALVERRLAACVSVGAAVSSCYPWKGQIEHDEELPVTIKTTPARLAALKQALPELHPYEVPELLAVPVADGLESYLEWMEEWLDE